MFRDVGDNKPNTTSSPCQDLLMVYPSLGARSKSGENGRFVVLQPILPYFLCLYWTEPSPHNSLITP